MNLLTPPLLLLLTNQLLLLLTNPHQLLHTDLPLLLLTHPLLHLLTNQLLLLLTDLPLLLPTTPLQHLPMLHPSLRMHLLLLHMRILLLNQPMSQLRLLLRPMVSLLHLLAQTTDQSQQHPLQFLLLKDMVCLKPQSSPMKRLLSQRMNIHLMRDILPPFPTIGQAILLLMITLLLWSRSFLHHPKLLMGASRPLLLRQHPLHIPNTSSPLITTVLLLWLLMEASKELSLQHHPRTVAITTLLPPIPFNTPLPGSPIRTQQLPTFQLMALALSNPFLNLSLDIHTLFQNSLFSTQLLPVLPIDQLLQLMLLLSTQVLLPL